MASRKTKEKIGFKDLVTFAKAGWTPEETNALLDRLEQVGDPNDPDDPADDDPDDPADDDPDDPADDDPDDPADDDPDDPVDDDPDDSVDDDPDDSLEKNLKKLKKLANENTRLKKELLKVQSKNKHKDLSGDNDRKSPEDSLIDVFQKCF